MVTIPSRMAVLLAIATWTTHVYLCLLIGASSMPFVPALICCTPGTQGCNACSLVSTSWTCCLMTVSAVGL